MFIFSELSWEGHPYLQQGGADTMCTFKTGGLSETTSMVTNPGSMNSTEKAVTELVLETSFMIGEITGKVGMTGNLQILTEERRRRKCQEKVLT